MATYANQSKSSTTFANSAPSRPELLIESTFNLLIGDGFKLDIERSFGNDWSNGSKTATTFANVTKN